MSIQDCYDILVDLPKFSADKLLGMTVLCTFNDEVMYTKVVCKVIDQDAESHQEIKFLLSLGDGQMEELISYN